MDRRRRCNLWNAGAVATGGTQASRLRHPLKDRNDCTQMATTHTTFACIATFNNTVHPVFQCPGGDTCLLIDVSASTHNIRNTVRLIVASITSESNAAGNLQKLPTPSGMTALVYAATKIREEHATCTKIICVTDGEEKLLFWRRQC